MPPDFLNSREDALMLWALVLLAFVTSMNGRSIGASFVELVRAVLHPKLLLLVTTTAAYSAGLVYAAARLGIWHTPALKETAYWFLGSAVVAVGEAVGSGALDGRRLLRKIVSVTLLVEFAANLYAFPLAAEIILVFVVLVCVMTVAYAEAYADSAVTGVRPLGKIANIGITLIGVSYLTYFLVRACSDLSAFLSRQTAEDFLVGPVLTVALIPLMLAFAWLSRHERVKSRRRLRPRLNSPA